MDIAKTLREEGFALDDLAQQRIAKYKELLWKWNRVHNLSGITSDEQLDAFIYDALFPVTFLPAVATAMDIGTGAGFPGMMLAIALPQTQVTLVEPLVKRASFLQFVKADLGLSNVTVANCRVEALPPQHFELITSRAVTDTQMLMGLSAPFRAPGTLLLFYKGEKVYDEVDPALAHRIIKANKRHYLLIEEPQP